MTFQKALQWLYSTQCLGIRLGVKNVQSLLSLLDHPEKQLRFLHVAGTNGKGSVCAFLDAILQADGRKTGLFTSPHLVDFRERICVSGHPISKEDTAEGLTLLRDLSNAHKLECTFFELATALAAWYFSRRNAEIIIWETGIGGQLDATNVVTPLASILTSISFDHQQLLGNSLGEIASEKAGIFKPGVPAVSMPQSAEVEQILHRKAVLCCAPLYFIETPWNTSKVGLYGEHQRWNAALAVAALDTGGITVSTESIYYGLANVQWPGRFQMLSNNLVIDGAHNLASTCALVATWKEVFGEQEACVVFGSLADKESEKMLDTLSVITREFRLVPVSHRRSSTQYITPAGKVAGYFDSLDAALFSFLKNERTMILVTGSLFLVGEILAQKKMLTYYTTEQ